MRRAGRATASRIAGVTVGLVVAGVVAGAAMALLATAVIAFAYAGWEPTAYLFLHPQPLVRGLTRGAILGAAIGPPVLVAQPSAC